MSGARQGRRRRILQEEVLSASRESSAYDPNQDGKPESGEGRRYALDEGSLGGALAKRHFPAQLLTPAVTLVGTVVTVAGLAAVHAYRATVAETLGAPAGELLDATSPMSLATWTASATMLAVAFMAVLILAVRRGRVDDYRGRHRLWRGAAAAALFLSFDAVTNFHSVAAEAAASLTGLRLMAGGAEWWLVIGSLVFGWVGFRVLVDMKESKLALAVLIAAITAGGVSAVAPIAGIGGQSASLVATLAQLSCYLLIGGSMVAYMRFLRQDVAAGVASKPQKSRATEVKLAKQTVSASKPQAEPTPSENYEAAPEDDDQPRTRRRAKQAKAARQSSETQWTDGSDGYQENYDDDLRPRKLSKAERKRIRQQKADRRAA